MKPDKSSFTAADAMPVKLLQNSKLIESIVKHKIILPLHVQLIPTNKCNLECSFCSCKNDDRSTEMSETQAIELSYQLKTLGTEGMTITGGGEPLLWPYLNKFLIHLNEIKIKVGLVTNGVLLSKHDPSILNTIEWSRISQGDVREKWSHKFLDRLSGVLKQAPNVGWAFSYVVSDKPDIEKIKELLSFANKNNFTHVRMVADLLRTNEIPMDKLKADLSEFIQDMKTPVLFQDRNEPEKGANCRICYIKPLITPDLKVYACCGVQYALKKPTLDFPSELCLGDISQLPEIIVKSEKPFEGAKYCEYCYYGNYNRTLDLLMKQTIHKEFA